METRSPVAPGLTALGDPTRGEIVRFLLDTPERAASVGRLTEFLALRQPTVSHHLRVLFDAGVLAREPRGREVWYSLPADVAGRLDEWRTPRTTAPLDAELLDRMVRDLEARFAGTVSSETVREVVLDCERLLAERDGGRATPSAISQFTSERLAALETTYGESAARANGAPVELLFVCVQNAGRSQLAAAIARHLGGDRVRVRTAGSLPISAVRPAVIVALDELGIPLGAEFPKPLTNEVVRAADVVVTMGCGDACPIYPGRRYLDWTVEDPAGQPIERVRVIRHDIDARVRGLLDELGVLAG